MTFKLTKQGEPHVASWWERSGDGQVRCVLCPRYCSLPEGSRGFCYLRQNIQGQLITHGSGMAVGLCVDPIEKKPLYHFYPGSSVLSFGTLGCNLGCKFCQNWHMSKVAGAGSEKSKYDPQGLVSLALERDCMGIAYTYNEPIIFGEWVREVAREAHAAGLKNVLVTNGYVTPQAREDLFEFVDAANVDLKAITEVFYRKLTLSHLEPVLDTLRWLVHETEVWLEITTLVIPQENDSSEELHRLTRFIQEELNPRIPLHFSAFHPDFKLRYRPSTPLETLTKAYDIARQNGLEFVYLGNILAGIGQDTICPQCQEVLVHRAGWSVRLNTSSTGNCPRCGWQIPGHFSGPQQPSLNSFGDVP